VKNLFKTFTFVSAILSSSGNAFADSHSFISKILNSFNGFFANSQLKIICDIDGEKVYVDKEFKGTCDADDPILIIVSSGKHNVEVKKINEDKSYYYFNKTVEVGDGVRLTIEVNAKKVYTDDYYYYKAKKEKNPDAYWEYLQKYPKGKYVAIVLQWLDNYYWNNCKSIPTCEEYLNKIKWGKHRQEAESKLEEFYFKKCQSFDSKACQIYTQKFPTGNFLKEVKLQEKINACYGGDISFCEYLNKKGILPKGLLREIFIASLISKQKEEIKVIRKKFGELRYRLYAMPEQFMKVSFSPDEKFIALNVSTYHVKICKTQNFLASNYDYKFTPAIKEFPKTYKAVFLPRKGKESILLVFHSNNKNGTIDIFSSKNLFQKPIRKIILHNYEEPNNDLNEMIVNNKGNLIALLSKGSVYVVNFDTGKVIKNISIEEPTSVDFGNKYLVVGSRKKFILLWNMETGKEKKLYFNTPIKNVNITKDDRIVIIGGNDFTEGIDLRTGYTVWKKGISPLTSFSADISKEGFVFALGTMDKVYLINSYTGKEIYEDSYPADSDPEGIYGVSFSPTLSMLFTQYFDYNFWIGSDNYIYVYKHPILHVRGKIFSLFKKLDFANPDLSPVQFTKKYLIFGNRKKGVIILSRSDFSPVKKLFYGDSIFRVSPDEKLLAVAGNDYKVRIFSMEDFTKPIREINFRAEITNIKYSPDGSLIAVATKDGNAYIYNTQNYQLVKHFQIGATLWALDFEADLFAVGGENGKIILWNYKTNNERKFYRTYKIKALKLSKDGKYLALGTWEPSKVTEVISTETGKTIWKKSITPSSSISFNISPDGKILVSAEKGGKVKFYDFATGEVLYSYEIDGNFISSTDFSKDFNYFAMGTERKLLIFKALKY
jgi:WD40 repeat protein